jgi:hypothetical protein
MANTVTQSDIKNRISARLQSKKAAAATASDPTEKGTAGIPTDPDASKDKQNLPADPTNASREGKDLTDKDTNPARTGKDVPSAADGDAQDKQTNVKKSASDILARVKNLRTKSASPAVTEPAPAAAPVTTKSAAPSEPALTLDGDAMMKLASAIFETEEGIDMVLPLVRKQLGREMAAQLVKQASADYNEMLEKQAAAAREHEEMRKYAAAREQYFENLYNSADTPAEGEHLVKVALAHEANCDGLTYFEKCAYDQGVADAGAMMGAEEEGGEPTIEGAEEPSLEQILALLEAAVSSGELDEATASQIAQELLASEGGAGGDPAAGGAPAPEGGEGAPAPEEAVKMASVQTLISGSKSLFEKISKKNK